MEGKGALSHLLSLQRKYHLDAPQRALNIHLAVDKVSPLCPDCSLLLDLIFPGSPTCHLRTLPLSASHLVQ